MNSAINTPWKKAVRVVASQGYRLHVVMEDDEDLDLTPLITTRESFWRLKNFICFRKVALDPLGGLCWPGGEEQPSDQLNINQPDRSDGRLSVRLSRTYCNQ